MDVRVKQGQLALVASWLLAAATFNFGLAYLNWGERGVRNRVGLGLR